MQVRKLTREEYFYAGKAQAVAFEGTFDPEKVRANLEKQEDPTAFPQKDIWGALEDDNSTLLGCMCLNHYTVDFQGTLLPMGGVGGVATFPTARRRGAIRRCMEKALADMLEKGYGFSCLYPFRTSYYRKFGFECGGGVKTWTIPMEDIPASYYTGTMTQIFPGDDLSPLFTVFQKVMAKTDFSVVRPYYSKELEEENFLNQKRYCYLWKDDAGEPQAFILFENREQYIDCRIEFGHDNGLYFANAEGFRTLLSFVKEAFASNYKGIRFMVQDPVDVQGLLPETATSSCTYSIPSMVRIISLEKVLQACRCKGEGSLILQVEDGMLPENSGTWKLTFAPGKENTVTTTNEDADLSLSIAQLSALVCGVKTAEDLPFMDVSLHHPEAPFQQVFYRKTYRLQELF